MAKTVEDYQKDWQMYKAEGNSEGMAAASAAADALRGEETKTVMGADGFASQIGVNSGKLYTLTSKNGTQNFTKNTPKNVKAGVTEQSYKSPYSTQIDSMLQNILNRKPFEYNHETDPLYQMYAKQYENNGQRAMQDTLGQVAARTGGMASSYATSASNQAYNNYMQELSNKIPDLYQIAYNRYMNERDSAVQNVGLLNDLDNTKYGRYRDNISDQKWQQEFDTSNSQWQQEFDWKKTTDEWNMKFQEDQKGFQRMLDRWITYGVATQEIADYFGVELGARTADYGLGRDQLTLEENKFAWQKSKSSGGSGGRGGRSSQNRNGGEGVSEEKTPVEQSESNSGVLQLEQQLFRAKSDVERYDIIDNSSMPETVKNYLIMKHIPAALKK